MRTQTFTRYRNDEITPELIEDAASLFTQHYGVWSNDADVKASKHGQPVRFTPGELSKALLPAGADCALVRVTVDGTLAGHALACYWNAPARPGKSIGWVTQLVVHRQHREIGLATAMLKMLSRADVIAWGILSSHPAALMATAKAFSTSIDDVDFFFIVANAAAIMESSPIPYVKNADRRGCIFIVDGNSSSRSSSYTRFFVDHVEPAAARVRVESARRWHFGGLDAGHEYLLIVEAK